MLLNNNHLFDHSIGEYKDISNVELGDEITLLAGQITAATYCFLKMLGEQVQKRMPGAYVPVKWSVRMTDRRLHPFLLTLVKLELRHDCYYGSRKTKSGP
ncbi:MAG: hypothetical protein ACI8WB_003651 [Phenylobacterium sp.]|jgi:hypothetical protein